MRLFAPARFLVVLVCLVMYLHGEGKRQVTAADCVCVKYLNSDVSHPGMALSRYSSRIAYLVKAPNLATNQNDIRLYVDRLGSGSSTPSKPILVRPSISLPSWMSDGKHLAVLIKESRSSSVILIDTDTGHQEMLIKRKKGIEEYSVDAKARTLVYSVKQLPEERQSQPTKSERARGYLVPSTLKTEELLPSTQIYVVRRNGMGSWSPPQLLTIKSDFFPKPTSDLPYKGNGQLSLSPSGQWLAVNLPWIDRVPTEWHHSPFVQNVLAKGFQYVAQIVVDMRTGETRSVFPSPAIVGQPLWSPDGNSFAIAGRSPVNSEWEIRDLANPRSNSPYHLFTVDLPTGSILEMPGSATKTIPTPLDWISDRRMRIQTGPNLLAEYTLRDGRWAQTQNLTLPPTASNGHTGDIASSEERVVTVHQNVMTPPELVVFNAGTQTTEGTIELNPEFKDFEIGPVEEVRWKTSTGYEIVGNLFKPPQYQKDKRYPLVIQTKPDMGSFVCDYGQDHYPSFAPRPIAAASMLYLMRIFPESWSPEEESRHYPEHLPGKLAEAAFQMDIWDSAVQELGSRGVIDPDKVGIIGFSRTGWHTEYMLVHGKTHYAAATVADNIQYSLGEYWHYRYEANLRGYDSLYGGPPYGPSLANWLNYSISFNLDKIHTPLMIEVMGGGLLDTQTKAPPTNLATKWEVAAGLEHLHRPVELYYYPDEEHQPDHPQARLASLERNIDWFRFWLLDEVNPSRRDQSKYARWEVLRGSEKGR